MNILIIVFALIGITVISILLFKFTSKNREKLNLESLDRLVARQIEYWKSQEENNIEILYSIADKMGKYGAIDPEQRRDKFDSLLYGIFSAKTNLIELYTVWKPNALDNMDEKFLGRAGSTETGQYAMSFTREAGEIKGQASDDIESSMEYLNKSDTGTDRVEDPELKMVSGNKILAVRMMVPVVNPETREVVGGVGLVLNAYTMQGVVLNTVRANKEIDIMAIYTNSGKSLGHTFPDRVGRDLLDGDSMQGAYVKTAYEAITAGTDFSDKVYDPVLKSNVYLNVKSFQIGNSDTSWSVLIGTKDTRILSEARSSPKFPVALTVITTLLYAAIIFLLLPVAIKPVIKLADTLNSIPDKDGNLISPLKH